jgi:hypothetical protein
MRSFITGRHLDASQFETFPVVSVSLFTRASASARILTAVSKRMQNVFSTFLMKVQLWQAMLNGNFRR